MEGMGNRKAAAGSDPVDGVDRVCVFVCGCVWAGGWVGGRACVCACAYVCWYACVRVRVWERGELGKRDFEIALEASGLACERQTSNADLSRSE